MSILIDDNKFPVGNAAGAGGGGAGSILFAGFVDTYAELPDPSLHEGEFWLVKVGSNPYIPLTKWFKYPPGAYVVINGIWDKAPLSVDYSETTAIRANISNWSEFYSKVNYVNVGSTLTYNGNLYTNTTGSLTSTPPDSDTTNWTSKVSFDTNNQHDVSEGQISWSNEDGTIQIGMPGGNVTLAVGQENLIRVKNVSGSIINNGDPVYITENPSLGFVTVAAADASDQDNCRRTLAIATEDIAINHQGFVTTFGQVHDVNTNGYTEGEEIFVAVGGGYTQVRPDLPNAIVRIGTCIQASSSEGIIFVDIAQRSSKGARTDSGDYTLYTAPGYTFVLDNPVYEDLNFAVASAGGPVATRPDYVTINNVVYSEFTNSNNQLCAAGEEVPHQYFLGGDLKLHLHGFLKQGESIGTTGVQFTIYWALREQNGITYSFGSAVFSKTSAELNNVCVSFYVAAGGLETISGPSTLGAQLSLTLARTGGNAGDFIVTTYGVHYPIDTHGSRLVSSK